MHSLKCNFPVPLKQNNVNRSAILFAPTKSNKLKVIIKLNSKLTLFMGYAPLLILDTSLLIQTHLKIKNKMLLLKWGENKIEV